MAEAFFYRNFDMWKIVVGFIIFAGLALFLLGRGGDIDLGGEKHGLIQLDSTADANVTFRMTVMNTYV